jgi:hypothetical protein
MTVRTRRMMPCHVVFHFLGTGTAIVERSPADAET